MDFQISRDELLREKELDPSFYDKVQKYEVKEKEQQILISLPKTASVGATETVFDPAIWKDHFKKAITRGIDAHKTTPVEQENYTKGFAQVLQLLKNGEDIKVKVDAEQSTRLQEILLSRGYSWGVVTNYQTHKIKHTEKPYFMASPRRMSLSAYDETCQWDWDKGTEVNLNRPQGIETKQPEGMLDMFKLLEANKDVKMVVNPETSRVVQEFLFEKGFRWQGQLVANVCGLTDSLIIVYAENKKITKITNRREPEWAKRHFDEHDAIEVKI